MRRCQTSHFAPRTLWGQNRRTVPRPMGHLVQPHAAGIKTLRTLALVDYIHHSYSSLYPPWANLLCVCCLFLCYVDWVRISNSSSNTQKVLHHWLYTHIYQLNLETYVRMYVHLKGFYGYLLVPLCTYRTTNRPFLWYCTVLYQADPGWTINRIILFFFSSFFLKKAKKCHTLQQTAST